MSDSTTEKPIALIVGGGPGISASCARLFSANEMTVAVAARRPDKPVLQALAKDHDVHLYQCDAADPKAVSSLFDRVRDELGTPRLVVHNIDGRSRDIFRKGVVEAEPMLVHDVLKNSALSAFCVAQQAAKGMLSLEPDSQGARGTIIFTNASAAIKGYPRSGAFAMASHAKAGLAESIARELMPEGIHVAHVPIDAAIGVTQSDGSRAHWGAGETREDNMADPDRIADLYLQLYRQHRSTWAFEVVLRPWLENW